MDIQSYLAAQLQRHTLTVTDTQLQQLVHYIELLQKWNKVYNLVANPGAQHIVDRHIIDSLLAAPYVQGPRLIDVGTGAGLPGIPLAIIFPEYQFVLLDSNGKKTRFVTQTKVELALHNVEVKQIRVETYQPDPLFNTVLSRAFASLAEMLDLTQHLCAEHGKFIALKGDNVAEEVAGMPSGFVCEHIEQLPFADEGIHRKIITVAKVL